MKKLFIASLVAFLLLPNLQAFAHPGRTDAKGGHTCNANCEKWGLKQGEYHFHTQVESVKVAPVVKTEAKKTAKKEAKIIK